MAGTPSVCFFQFVLALEVRVLLHVCLRFIFLCVYFLTQSGLDMSRTEWVFGILYAAKLMLVCFAQAASCIRLSCLCHNMDMLFLCEAMSRLSLDDDDRGLQEQQDEDMRNSPGAYTLDDSSDRIDVVWPSDTRVQEVASTDLTITEPDPEQEP